MGSFIRVWGQSAWHPGRTFGTDQLPEARAWCEAAAPKAGGRAFLQIVTKGLSEPTETYTAHRRQWR